MTILVNVAGKEKAQSLIATGSGLFALQMDRWEMTPGRTTWNLSSVVDLCHPPAHPAMPSLVSEDPEMG